MHKSFLALNMFPQGSETLFSVIHVPKAGSLQPYEPVRKLDVSRNIRNIHPFP